MPHSQPINFRSTQNHQKPSVTYHSANPLLYKHPSFSTSPTRLCRTSFRAHLIPSPTPIPPPSNLPHHPPYFTHALALHAKSSLSSPRTALLSEQEPVLPELEWMELQCVESLGPDPSSTSFSSHPHSLIQLPSSSLSTDVTSSCIHQLPNSVPTRFTPNIRSYHTLSPLTCTPTSSPKRRRISHISTVPHNPNSSSRSPQSHPLTSLAQRDIPYAIQNTSHLNGTFVTPEMREEVVAWCSDMTDDLHLSPAMVAMAINIFDRFLMVRPVSKTLLYPLTAACLLLACKILMDEHIPCHEIASRSRVTVKDIQAMESVVLNVLNWRVNIVTPHEVAHELVSCFEGKLRCHKPLLDCLLLNSLSEYGLAWLRATSIGVACFILCASVTQGEPVDLMCDPVLKLAGDCDVDIEEVRYCINWLRDSMHALFSEVEKCDSE